MKTLLSVIVLSTMLLTGAAANAEVATPRIKCAYVLAGPVGPKGNKLNIRVNGPEESTAVRVLRGGRIEVTDDRRMRRLRCTGRKATVTNIDRVDYRATRASGTTSLTVVSPLRFAPGTRSYMNGGSGISFKVVGKSIIFGMRGTGASDTILTGTKGKATGIDFGQEPARNGIDAWIFAGSTSLVALMGGGNDYFDGSGFAYFDGPLVKTAVSVYGEAGNDQIEGGNGPDYLDGGAGADSLIGRNGPDTLVGGPGIDGFDAGYGADEVEAIDRRPEQIECGPGNDLSAMDLVDEDSNCEMFSFP